MISTRGMCPHGICRPDTNQLTHAIYLYIDQWHEMTSGSHQLVADVHVRFGQERTIATPNPLRLIGTRV
jgi:hypothetical protein